MVADQDLVILIVEDEQALRHRIKQWLELLGRPTFLEAEHMEKAREILRDHWDEIGLILMDVMLPEDESRAQQARDLIVRRESAYDGWLALEEEGRSDDDPDWRRAHFAVDAHDRQIFELLNVEGGIDLIQERVNQGGGGRLQKPVLYLTARENQHLRDQGMSLIIEGKACWLVKPITSQDVLLAARRLLAKE